MPELPEIETIKLQLQQVLVGQKLVRVEVLSPKSVQGNIKLLEGQKVVGIRRKAKVLLIDFSKDLTAALTEARDKIKDLESKLATEQVKAGTLREEKQKLMTGTTTAREEPASTPHTHPATRCRPLRRRSV